MLLHRPVPRSVIFFGKAAAGLLLYFSAATLPLLISAAYVAAPGQLAAPFLPRMFLPALSDLLLGAAFYFAALLMSLSRGPWAGRRGLLGLSLVPLFIHQMTGEHLFLVPIGAVLALMAAALGAMKSNGLMRGRTLIERIGFVFVALAAVGVVVLLLDAGISALPSKDASETPNSGYWDSVLTGGGEVLVEHRYDDGSVASLTDTNGKPISDNRDTESGNIRSLYRFTAVCDDFGLGSRFMTVNMENGLRDLRNYVELMGTDSETPENWYRLVRENYFVGYDKLSRRCIGICDREGFHPPGAIPEPFKDQLAPASKISVPLRSG